MTKSKIDLAIILSCMRGKNEDPLELAASMSVRKLCYEIEKCEVPEIEVEVKIEEIPVKKKKHFMSWLTEESSDDEK